MGEILVLIIVALVVSRLSSSDEKDWNTQEIANSEMAMQSQQGLYAQYEQPAQVNYQQQVVQQPVVQQQSPQLSQLPGNPVAAAPSAPTMYDVGTMRSDGNEWLEYPAASGAWYMRDPTTRQWVRRI